jgi:hypothetical protein
VAGRLQNGENSTDQPINWLWETKRVCASGFVNSQADDVVRRVEAQVSSDDTSLMSEVLEGQAFTEAWYARTKENPARSAVELFRHTNEARAARRVTGWLEDLMKRGNETARMPTVRGPARRAGRAHAPTLADWEEEYARALFRDAGRDEWLRICAARKVPPRMDSLFGE